MRETRGRLLIGLGFLLVLFTFWGNPAFARQKDPALLELEEYFALVEEELPPVVTGISRPLRKEEVPASITVVTADEIKALGLRHLTDVINYLVPGGVGDIHRSTRTGLYSFRGISVDNNGKFVFMVDGLNSGSLTAWGAFNERYLGLMDELERIEIIQGTGSILYGSGAISGIINFITKTGKDFQGVEFTSGYGSWEKKEVSLKVGKETDEEHDYFYYLGYKHSQGSTPKGGGGPTLASTNEQVSGPGRYWDRFDHSGKFQANIHRGDFGLKVRYVQEVMEEPFTRAGRTVQCSDTFRYQNYLFVQPEIQKKLSEKSRIRANLAFGMDEAGFRKYKDWKTARAGEKVRTLGERKLRGQFFHYYDGFKDHRLTSGAEIFWLHSGPDFAGDSYTRKTTQTPHVATEDLYFAALFFEDIWRMSEKTTIFAGARWEDHSKTQMNLSPRLALSHDYNDKTNVKVLYNYGFRTPDWAYYDVNKDNDYPAPEPEEVHSFEAHLSRKFNPNLNTTLVGYYTYYKDIINWFSTAGETGFRNFKDVRAAGIEASGSYRGKALKVNLTHSFSRPVHLAANNYPESDDVVNLSFDERNWSQFPTHMTKANAIWRLGDRCTLGFTFFRPWGIFGHRAPEPKLKDASNYLNATLTWKAGEDTEIQLSGYNLLGEDNPWWGMRTRDGVSRAVDPHTEYFVKVIRRF